VLNCFTSAMVVCLLPSVTTHLISKPHFWSTQYFALLLWKSASITLVANPFNISVPTGLEFCTKAASNPWNPRRGRPSRR
jgi:hypothetical protein